MKESLFCKEIEEIQLILSLEKKFQARIVRNFLIKGVTDFENMTSLPKKDRQRLGASALTTQVVERMDSLSTIKLAIRLQDGLIIECVRLSDGKDRYTACLSSQVGCAMGCSFCKTGTMGLLRNLTASEIVEQFVQLQKLGEPISHIVFMGMGEALANFNPVMEAIRCLHDEQWFGISYRKITISTCGLVPAITRLAEVDLPIRLAVSLVSANDEVRSRIMKINRAYPLSDLKKALISFQHQGNKRITLEYCMLSGINTDEESAKELQKFTRGLDALVNLIPWNPVEEMDFKTPGDKEIDNFTRLLARMGVNYTIRRSKGREISGACGQLAAENGPQE